MDTDEMDTDEMDAAAQITAVIQVMFTAAHRMVTVMHNAYGRCEPQALDELRASTSADFVLTMRLMLRSYVEAELLRQMARRLQEPCSLWALRQEVRQTYGGLIARLTAGEIPAETSRVDVMLLGDIERLLAQTATQMLTREDPDELECRRRT